MIDRVLMVATVPSMIGQFNMDNIYTLQRMGYQLDVATDFDDTSVWPLKRTSEFKKEMCEQGVRCIKVSYSRNPFNFIKHVKSYRQTKDLIKENGYAFIHTHTPIASSIVRLAAHKTHTKVIYTAHGFHFYNGAPIRNWLVFYPVEWFLSRWTDVLITINKEDYVRAQDHFKAKLTVYIPGVGVDTEKFKPRESVGSRLRSTLGIYDSDVMLLSVGELNENKNHASVIRAISGLGYTYVIVGKGDKADELVKLAQEYGVDLRLMGYRNDVADFYNAADAYVLPSFREGLNVSLMEAMASGLSVACGRIRGNVDLIDENDGTMFDPNNIAEIRSAITTTLARSKELGAKNLRTIRTFDVMHTQQMSYKIYATMRKAENCTKLPIS